MTERPGRLATIGGTTNVRLSRLIEPDMAVDSGVKYLRGELYT